MAEVEITRTTACRESKQLFGAHIQYTDQHQIMFFSVILESFTVEVSWLQIFYSLHPFVYHLCVSISFANVFLEDAGRMGGGSIFNFTVKTENPNPCHNAKRI